MIAFSRSKPCAEAMNGGNICALDLLADLGSMGESTHHPLLDLGGGFVSKRDREDAAWVNTVLADQPCEALDQYTGFTGSRPGDNANILAKTMRGIESAAR